ncbi:MAG: UDP-N-acetylmuramate dehydrogenase [Simkaniaceae bacterium]
MLLTKLKIFENEPLSKYTTFGIGGPARFFTIIKNLDELQEALSFSNEKQIPYFILGKGSNLLFDDRGLNRLVILNKIDYIKQENNIFHVGGGTSFSRLGSYTARKRYCGLEFASGIPGSVGGAVYMNAGANGQETKDSLVQALVVDRSGLVKKKLNSDFSFGYRSSLLQTTHEIVIEASFKLTESSIAREKQLAILGYRKATQPYSEKSAGCIFRNPLEQSAGSLIEEAGLKGLRVGDAEISLTHANFIVNRGRAKAKDVLFLIEKIKEQVEKKKGAELKIEVKVIPYE